MEQDNKSMMIVEEDDASFEARWDEFLAATEMDQLQPEVQASAQRVFYAGALAFLNAIDQLKPQSPGVSAMLASVNQLGLIQQEIISFFEDSTEEDTTLMTMKKEEHGQADS